ncbi:hypothetical protein SRB5_47170 [Streptomyces sp. RB5]|uniref:Class F sortase n=1 Tax=Streptomyces smaragdinus TaxID=2585196 RepID=A0A7K0CM37_9ACTN|nr:sortase [Streptomyces smaragdinus]MQY14549.1 hypothetical protein [Streptomyces smaragdinus]
MPDRRRCALRSAPRRPAGGPGPRKTAARARQPLSRARRLRRTLLAVAALITAVTVAVTLTGGGDEPPRRRKRAAVTALGPSRPVSLRIDSIGLTARVTPLGLTPAGALDAPPKKQLDTTGWYRGSVTPGERGSAVVVGHVDSARRRSVFFRLSELAPGRRIAVRRADGSTARFTVDSRDYIRAADFPGRRIVTRTGPPGLWLITCAPPYNARTKTYESTLLVHARLTGTTPAPA